MPFPRRVFAIAAALLIAATLAPAQEDLSKAAAYSGSMGTVTVDGQQLYRLSFRPDIPIGNWGLALDVELFLDEDGDFSDRGWEFGTSTEALDTFLRKFYYVRYGQPEDDTYVKIGALDEVTLGYGLIMDRYRNTLQYPGIKKTGLQFKVDHLGGSNWGAEGVINNFQDFEEGSALVGLRVFGRPAGKLELGVSYVVDLDQYGGLLDSDGDGFPDAVDAFPDNDALALDNDGDRVADEEDGDDDNDGVIDVDAGSGLSADLVAGLRDLNATHGDEEFPIDTQVTRKSPFNKDRIDRDRFGIFGFDAAYPLIEQDALQLKLYGQLAILLDDDDELGAAAADSQGVTGFNRKTEGMGVAAPGLWLGLGPLTGQVEFRHFRDDFDSGYFDNLYEVDRARLDVATGLATPKDALLGRDEHLSGVFGRIGTEIAQLFYASADYQHLSGGSDPKQQVHASARLAPSLLENIPRLGPSLLPRIFPDSAQAYYQKNNIGLGLNDDGDVGSEDGFLESTEDTFYGYELGLEMTGGVSIYWDIRYVFERGADLKLRRRKITNIETVFKF